MKILVRNLARTTSEAEIRTLFEVHGKVQSCKLVMDNITGESKGFGFIEMPKPGDVKAAIKNLNGKEVNGNKIRVKKAESKHDLKNDVENTNAQYPEQTDSSEKNWYRWRRWRNMIMN